MTISLFSILMSAMFSTVFILAIHFLRNRPFFLKSFGVHTLILMYGLCLFRMVFVMETPFTFPVGLRGSFSQICAWVLDAQISAEGVQIGLTDLLVYIWFITAVVLFARSIWREYSVWKELAGYAENKSFAAEQALKKVQSESLRKVSVGVCVCPDIDVPMGLGLFHKMIYLPDEEYKKEELYYILKHEYTHFCNRDFVVNLLTTLFRCIFWWNPAAYLLKKDINQILEIKCDVNATQGFTKKERLEYLLTIVRVLKGAPPTGRANSSLMATGLLSRTKRDDIRERFELITKATKHVGVRYQAAFIGVAVLMTLFSYAFVLQSAFDPPVEDIYTDSSVQEWDDSEYFILKSTNGKYYMVLVNGERFEIDKEIAKEFISDGVDYREDNIQ